MASVNIVPVEVPPRNAAVTARLNLIQKPRVGLPAKSGEASDNVQVECAAFAQRLTSIVEGAEGYDTGRLIATLDLVNQVSETAQASIALPHLGKH
jgi:hypothetical protein